MDGNQIIRPAVLLVVLFCSLMITASAVPPLPAEFYGSVSVDGTPAASGTGIIAKINDQIRGKLAITSGGSYGGTGIFDDKLVVAATEDDVKAGNAQVSFYIGDKKADQSVAFEPGKIQKLDLTSGGGPLPVLSASFTAAPVSGAAPLEVTFTDTSTGTPVTWYWDFGDGLTSGEQSPKHTYTTNGLYSVTLTVSDATGASSTKKMENGISVGGSSGIVADFTATPTSGTAPLTVQFTDISSGNPTMWAWDFGDGGVTPMDASCSGADCINIANPKHTYQNPGTYTVTLTASSQTGGSSTKVREGYITVSSTGGIIADFEGIPTSGTAPLTVQFTDKSTGNPTMWAWEFGDGTSEGMLANPIHTYQNPGTYTVKLTASSQTGGSATKVREGYITVSSTGGIIADFEGIPTSGTAPLTVQFTDKSTGSPTMWAWEFGDGTSEGMLANPTHTYQNPGTYTVKLTASSQTGGSATKVRESYIVVSGSGQGPKAAFTVDKKTGPKPLTVQFTDTSTGNPTMWAWDFGDGTSEGMLANPTHTYEQAGVYTVSLTASNTLGSDKKTEKDFISVTGDIPPPVAMFEGSPLSGTAPLTVSFKDLSIGPPTGYAWDFGDGTSSTEAEPTHTYSQPGTYTVTLKVTNSGGSHVMKRDNYVTVSSGSGIVADFEGTPTSGYAPLTVQFTDKSTGNPTMWAWDFGDEGVTPMDASCSGAECMNIANPKHTYQNPGTYTVTLTASSQTGGTSTKVREGYITVSSSGGIIADFSAAPTRGNAPLTVQFTDLSIGNPTMWAWEFGDSTSEGMLANPIHTYQNPGTYTVKLTASSQTGGTSTKVREGYITVSSSGGIVADFSATPTRGSAPLSVQFKDQSSGSPTMWAWEFGDGGTDLVANPVHVYRSPGSYTVKLTASNMASSSTVVKDRLIQVDQPGPYVPGQIKITYAPDRSQVYLNGQLQGETKFLQTYRIQSLQPGIYQLKITKPGFTDYVRDIPVAAGKVTEIVADMRIAPTQNGILSVYSYPAGAQVYVDGSAKGTAPLWLADVPPGVHSIKVSAPDYLDWTEQVTVNGGGSVTYVTAALYPSWWAPLYGYLMVSSLPGNGVAYLDGIQQGTTPLTLSQVSPGVHTVRIEVQGYAPWEQQVTVMEGRTAYVIAQMNQGQSATPITQMSVTSAEVTS